MRTLVAKLGLDQRQIKVGRKGTIVFLVFWGLMFSAGIVFALSGPADVSTFSVLFASAACFLLAIAELFHENALNLAIATRAVSVLAALMSIFFFAVDVYQRSGPLVAVTVFGLITLVVFVGLYLQGNMRKSLDRR